MTSVARPTADLFGTDQDEAQEECQEGNSVLSDGLRCFRNRSALRQETYTRLELTSLGRTTFVNTLCGKSVLEGKDADDAVNAHLEEGVRIKPVTVGKEEMVHTYKPQDGS